MKALAYVLAAVFALVSLLIILGAATSDAGLGPLELLVALIPLAIAVVLVQTSRGKQ